MKLSQNFCVHEDNSSDLTYPDAKELMSVIIVRTQLRKKRDFSVGVTTFQTQVKASAYEASSDYRDIISVQEPLFI